MLVKITDNCVGCGICELICPDVFYMGANSALANEVNIETNEEGCINAALCCPSNAIWIDDIL